MNIGGLLRSEGVWRQFSNGNTDIVHNNTGTVFAGFKVH
jgi:hypothetical protein